MLATVLLLLHGPLVPHAHGDSRGDPSAFCTSVGMACASERRTVRLPAPVPSNDAEASPCTAEVCVLFLITRLEQIRT
jgi:hypothetical protein